jgi:hypothetical protein
LVFAAFASTLLLALALASSTFDAEALGSLGSFGQQWNCRYGLTWIYGSFWHAADTAPLEGLLILRCAIYDPWERLQISKMRLSEMVV